MSSKKSLSKRTVLPDEDLFLVVSGKQANGLNVSGYLKSIAGSVHGRVDGLASKGANATRFVFVALLYVGFVVVAGYGAFRAFAPDLMGGQ